MNNVLFAQYLKLRDLQTRFEQITGDCNSEQLPEIKPPEPRDYKKEAIAALIDNKKVVVGAAALGAYGLYKSTQSTHSTHSTQSTQSALTNTDIEIALQAEIAELEKKLDDCHKSQYESYFSKFEREVASTQEKIKFAISHLVEQKNENKGLKQQVQVLEANQQSLEKQNKDLAVALEQEKNEQIALRKSGCENLRVIATALDNTPCNKAAITVPDPCSPNEITDIIKNAIKQLAVCMKKEKEEVENRQKQQDARQAQQNTKEEQQKKKEEDQTAKEEQQKKKDDEQTAKEAQQQKKEQEQAAKDKQQTERQDLLDKKEREQTDLLQTVRNFANERCKQEVSGDINDLLNNIVQCTECSILEELKELKMENNICKVASDALKDKKNCRESINNAFKALVSCSTSDNANREQEKVDLCDQLKKIAQAISSLCPPKTTPTIPPECKPSEYAEIIHTSINEIKNCLQDERQNKIDELQQQKQKYNYLCSELKTINTAITVLCPKDAVVNADCKDNIGATITDRIKKCFESENKKKDEELKEQTKKDQKTTCVQLQSIIAALNTNKCLPATKIDDITPETCEPVTVTTNIIARITDIFNCFEKEKTQKDTDIQQQKKATCSHLQKIITALNENECLLATKLKDIESEICDPGIVTPIITAAIEEILTCFQNEKAKKDLEIRNQKNDLTEKLKQWCKNIEFIVTKLKEIPCLDADSQTKLSKLAIGCDENTIDKIKAAIDILVECIKKEKDDAIKTEKQNADTMLLKVQTYVKDHCDETGPITESNIDILLGKLDRCTECKIINKIKDELKDRLAECPLAAAALENEDCKKAIVDAVGSLMTCFDQKLNIICNGVKIIVTKLTEIPCVNEGVQKELQRLVNKECNANTFNEINEVIRLLVNCIKADKTEKDNAILTLKTEKTNLQGQVTGLKQKNSKLQGQVTGLEMKNSALQGQLDMRTQENSALQGQLDMRTQENSALRETVTELQGQVTVSEGKLTNILEELKRYFETQCGVAYNGTGNLEDLLTKSRACIKTTTECNLLKNLESLLPNIKVDTIREATKQALDGNGQQTCIERIFAAFKILAESSVKLNNATMTKILEEYASVGKLIKTTRENIEKVAPFCEIKNIAIKAAIVGEGTTIDEYKANLEAINQHITRLTQCLADKSLAVQSVKNLPVAQYSCSKLKEAIVSHLNTIQVPNWTIGDVAVKNFKEGKDCENDIVELVKNIVGNVKSVTVDLYRRLYNGGVQDEDETLENYKDNPFAKDIKGKLKILLLLDKLEDKKMIALKKKLDSQFKSVPQCTPLPTTPLPTTAKQNPETVIETAVSNLVSCLQTFQVQPTQLKKFLQDIKCDSGKEQDFNKLLQLVYDCGTQAKGPAPNTIAQVTCTKIKQNLVELCDKKEFIKNDTEFKKIVDKTNDCPQEISEMFQYLLTEIQYIIDKIVQKIDKDQSDSDGYWSNITFLTQNFFTIIGKQSNISKLLNFLAGRKVLLLHRKMTAHIETNKVDLSICNNTITKQINNGEMMFVFTDLVNCIQTLKQTIDMNFELLYYQEKMCRNRQTYKKDDVIAKRYFIIDRSEGEIRQYLETKDPYIEVTNNKKGITYICETIYYCGYDEAMREILDVLSQFLKSKCTGPPFALIIDENKGIYDNHHGIPILPINGSRSEKDKFRSFNLLANLIYSCGIKKNITYHDAGAPRY